MESQVLRLVGDLMGLTTLEELRPGLVDALYREVRTDWVSLNDVGPDPASVVTVMRPDAAPAGLFERWAALAYENPLVQAIGRDGDGRARRFSDVCTRAELQATALYREVYVPLGVEFQIAFTLPADPGRIVGVALSRADSDFTDDERDLLNLARPYVIQAYRNAIDHDRLRAAPAERMRGPLTDRGLTGRETDALILVAHGCSARRAAGVLGISERTVQKHLERAYRKLDAAGRDEATSRCWALAEA
jgi:DNA-binding CsgD family transcriptional regulator